MKIDVISGFLGAGKTTLIKKLLSEEYGAEKVVLIENELGEVGIDGELLRSHQLEIKEIYSGCICCTLKGNLKEAMVEIIKNYSPERIIIEPSGVAKLSLVLDDLWEYSNHLNLLLTVVDPLRYFLYRKNFADFYGDQIKNASALILSRTHLLDRTAIDQIIEDIRTINQSAPIITSIWEKVPSKDIINAAGKKEVWKDLLVDMSPSPPPFEIWGERTEKTFPLHKITEILSLLNEKGIGNITRAKGILKGEEGWYHFDYCGGEKSIVSFPGDHVGCICVIGCELNKDRLKSLFLGCGGSL